jgi:hypothetical protein
MTTTWINFRQIRTYVWTLLTISLLTSAVIAVNGSALRDPARVTGEVLSADLARQTLFLNVLVLVLPVLVGTFIGARLATVAALEDSLAFHWTQSMTRTQLWWSEVIVGGGSTMVVVAPLAIASRVWWTHTFSAYQPPSTTNFFLEPPFITLVALAAFGISFLAAGQRRPLVGLATALLVMVVNAGVIAPIALPALLGPTVAVEQWDPQRTVPLVVPFAPSGGTVLYRGFLTQGATFPPLFFDASTASDAGQRCLAEHPITPPGHFSGSAIVVAEQQRRVALSEYHAQLQCESAHGVEFAIVSLSASSFTTLQIIDALLLVGLGGGAVLWRRRRGNQWLS